MRIHLSPDEGVPIYLQIVSQIKSQVAAGRLGPGEELPAIRALAERLVVNPNTVARAYRELETAGIITKRRATGTYVSETSPSPAQGKQWHHLTERVDALLAEAHRMNVTLQELFDLIRYREAEMVMEPAVSPQEEALP